MLAAKSAKNMDKREPANASSSARGNRDCDEERRFQSGFPNMHWFCARWGGNESPQTLPVQQALNFPAGRPRPSSVFLDKFRFCSSFWGPEGGMERLITGTKIFPPASTGAEQGINPERAGCAAKDAIQ